MKTRLLLLTMSMALTSQAQTNRDPVSGFNYRVENGEAIMCDNAWYTGDEIIVPKKIGKYKVTGIDEEAFAACFYATNIVVPGTITRIGMRGFDSAFSLRILSLGEGIEVIEPMAFFFCSSLENVYIPNSVRRIEWCAFECCYVLQDISIPGRIEHIGDWTFWECPLLTPDNIEFRGRNKYSLDPIWP